MLLWHPKKSELIENLRQSTDIRCVMEGCQALEIQKDEESESWLHNELA